MAIATRIGKKPTFVAAALAGILAVLATVIGAGSTPPWSTGVVASDLEYPRGLTPLRDGGLLVAEVMGRRLLRLTPEGDVTVLADGLPATFAGPGGQYPTGISAGVEANGSYYYVVGEARGRDYSALYALHPDSGPEMITGGIDSDGFPATPITNPYDLVLHADDGFLVSDGGRNAILHIDQDGTVTEYATFKRRPHPDPGMRSTVDVVPTGITYGPDGALYMASLTGYPHIPGFAAVYRLEDLDGDGAAMGNNEVTVYAQGFSFATDVAFAEDGSLLVTEFTTDMQRLVTEHGLDGAEALPGRLVRWHDGVSQVLADNLVTPTSLAVADGRVLVSEELAGRITEVRLSKAPPLERWVPPSLAGLGAVVAVVAGSAFLSRRR